MRPMPGRDIISEVDGDCDSMIASSDNIGMLREQAILGYQLAALLDFLVGGRLAAVSSLCHDVQELAEEDGARVQSC
eukprot:3895870-Amphidinium_carterae.2